MFLDILDSHPTELNTYLYNYWQLYNDDINTLNARWWKDEDIWGSSCRMYKVYQYYFAFYYVELIYIEYNRGFNTEYSYYETKYNIEETRKKLGCNGINLSRIFEIFGLFLSENDGIEGMGIEQSFVVEPNNVTVTPVTYVISNLINNPYTCTSIFNNC